MMNEELPERTYHATFVGGSVEILKQPSRPHSVYNEYHLRISLNDGTLVWSEWDSRYEPRQQAERLTTLCRMLKGSGP